MSSLGRFRLILKKQGLMVVVAHLFAKKVANVPDGLLNDFRGAALPRRPLMVLIYISVVVAHSPRPPPWPRI